MGRQKKNELDSVLEQLKRSYSAEYNYDAEDSLRASEGAEEDEELSSILERIFSDPNTQKDVECTDIADNEDESAFEHDPMLKTETEHSETIIDGDESNQDQANEETMLEEERVDKVLEIMFGSQSPISNDNILESDDNILEEIDGEAESSGENEQVYTFEKGDIDHEASISDIQTDLDSSVPNDETDASDVSDVIIYVDTPDIVESADASCSTDGDAEAFDISISPNNKVNATIKVVLDKKEYTEDPLQYSSADLGLYKPEKDFQIPVSERSALDIDKDKTEKSSSTSTESSEDISDKDISLFMKFGYDGETYESNERIRANKVLFEQSKKYIPEKHKIRHGFTGEEFYDLSQIPSIKKKYRNDKIGLLVKALIVSAIALLMVTTDITAVLNRWNNDVLIPLNSILAVMVGAILFNKIYSGISALINYDGNDYSLPSILLIEYLISNLAIYIINLSIFEISLYASFGGYVLLVIAFTVWGEWLDCCREIKVFDFISKDGVKYVAEKRASSYKLSSYNSDAPKRRYIIKRSDFIIGYHRKTIDSKREKIYTFILIGLLPIISAVFGTLNVLINKNFILGINVTTYILFLSAPISSAIYLSILRFAEYKKLLKECSVVGIGSFVYEEMAKVETIVTEDVDAVNIIGCKEIDPNNTIEKSQKWSDIARDVLIALGGPMSKFLSPEPSDKAKVHHDIIINSISDNGIDLHFDSSINVLMGDRQYMRSQNIKVKTDVNLTGAVKGAESSVIYMAFDKIPRIGFIINSSISNSFMEIIEVLQRNSINLEVKSYEPQINEYFFEIKDIHYPVSVEKPMTVESFDQINISNSKIVSSDPLGLCKAIEYSKQASNDYAKYKKSKIMKATVGCLIACFLAFIRCLPIKSAVLDNLWTYAPIFLYFVSAIILVWDIVKIVKIIKRR